MQLNPSEISELIKSRIQGLEASADVRNQGTVISVTDGIVRIHGLSEVMQGEMLEFPGNTFGLALNLERDSVGAVILGIITFMAQKAWYHDGSESAFIKALIVALLTAIPSPLPYFLFVPAGLVGLFRGRR